MMKKIPVMLLISLAVFFGLTACAFGTAGDGGGTIGEDDASVLTVYANGGMIVMGEDPYEMDLGAYTVEPGIAFGEGMGEPMGSVSKEGAEFVGWKIYAVSEGEWVTEAVGDLADGAVSVPCGDYGYYIMKTYEVLSETATTEEMLSCKADGRDYLVLAIWS